MSVPGLRIAAAAAALFALSMPPAQAADWFEMQVYLTGPRYDGIMPPCEAGLPWVAARFHETEAKFWNSRLQIVGFEHVRETAYRPWAANTIPRRFCSARARVTDGRHHMVYYSIGEDTGFMGASYGVNYCVVGLDRNWAYNPACKMARP